MASAFISYAHEDQEFVLVLVDQLQAQGIDTLAALSNVSGETITRARISPRTRLHKLRSHTGDSLLTWRHAGNSVM